MSLIDYLAHGAAGCPWLLFLLVLATVVPTWCLVGWVITHR